MQRPTNSTTATIQAHPTETLVQTKPRSQGLKVKAHIKAGGMPFQHNETQVQAKPQPQGLRVKTQVKAGVNLDQAAQPPFRIPPLPL